MCLINMIEGCLNLINYLFIFIHPAIKTHIAAVQSIYAYINGQ
jgi:hypothetical protein